jgi:hypothetical protein
VGQFSYLKEKPLRFAADCVIDANQKLQKFTGIDLKSLKLKIVEPIVCALAF